MNISVSDLQFLFPASKKKNGFTKEKAFAMICSARGVDPREVLNEKSDGKNGFTRDKINNSESCTVEEFDTKHHYGLGLVVNSMKRAAKDAESMEFLDDYLTGKIKTNTDGMYPDVIAMPRFFKKILNEEEYEFLVSKLTARMEKKLVKYKADLVTVNHTIKIR